MEGVRAVKEAYSPLGTHSPRLSFQMQASSDGAHEVAEWKLEEEQSRGGKHRRRPVLCVTISRPNTLGAGALLCTDLPIYGSATLIIQNRQWFLRRCGCLAAEAEHGGRNGEMWQVSQRHFHGPVCVVMRPNRPQLPIQKGTHKVSKFGPLTSVIHRSMRQGYP